MPVKAEWTNYVESYFDTQEIPAETQFDIAMTLQKFYCEHNVSYTIEYDEDEIDQVASLIEDAIREGEYVSFAMMQRARAGQLKHTFPRLPYEPISKEEYEKFSSEIDRNVDFDRELALAYQDANEENKHDVGTTGCDSTGCTL
jgi:ribonucleotide reductase class II